MGKDGEKKKILWDRERELFEWSEPMTQSRCLWNRPSLTFPLTISPFSASSPPRPLTFLSLLPLALSTYSPILKLHNPKPEPNWTAKNVKFDPEKSMNSVNSAITRQLFSLFIQSLVELLHGEKMTWDTNREEEVKAAEGKMLRTHSLNTGHGTNTYTQ